MTDQSPERYAIMFGNPCDGFQFMMQANGELWTDASEANDAADAEHFECEWWVVPIIPATTDPDEDTP